MHAVSPEPSLLSHMRKMGVHTAYSFSQCADEPKRVCCLARVFTALAHAKNGRSYGTFFQSMLRRDLVCVQSRQSLQCSRTCTKWAYIQHIISINAQTRLSMRTVSSDPLLLAHCQNGCWKRIIRQSLSMFTDRIYTYTMSTKIVCDGSNIIHV